MKKLIILAYISFITQISFAQILTFYGFGYYEVSGPSGDFSGFDGHWILGGPGDYTVNLYEFNPWDVDPESYGISGDQSGGSPGIYYFTIFENAISFTNGASFTPSVTRDNINQAIGRFHLDGDESGASLTAASIKLNGTRTGITNIKLWSSTDATFVSGSDTQLGSTVSSDPGAGNSASFSGLSNSISTSGTYYFVTCDLAADATGSVRGVIVANSNLTISGGSISSSIDNTTLSTEDVSLPVELSLFTVEAGNQGVICKWTTESETENLGFILERKTQDTDWSELASYKTDDRLLGRGSTPSATDYEYIDNLVEPNTTYEYRLADVDYYGTITYHATRTVTVEQILQSSISEDFTVLPAYPNPFNPSTTISYGLDTDNYVTVEIYDIIGKLISTLQAKNQTQGWHSVIWNGTNQNNEQVPAGLYLSKITSGSAIKTSKLMMLK